MEQTPRLDDDGSFTIRKGDTFEMTLVYKDAEGNPIDLTDATGVLQAYKEKGANPEINATTEGTSPQLVFGGAEGTIDISVPCDVTGKLSFNSGIYGLKITLSSGKCDTILDGIFNALEAIVKT